MYYEKRHRHHNRDGRRGSGPWKRRMARVPKGHLRHYVLKLLDESPMSGSEIMSTISKRTEERWQPSPGSVYPLLSWLQDSAYIEEVSEKEAGIKRYQLTESGREFLKEHDEFNPDFEESLADIGPRFRGAKDLPEDARELYRSIRKSRKLIRKLFDRLRKDYSEELVKEAKDSFDELLAKLEVLTQKE